MCDSLKSSPFVAFSMRHRPRSSNDLYRGSHLEMLGYSTAGKLYFNKDLASVGFICGGLVEDVDVAVKRLVASHLGDRDTRLLILNSDRSTVTRKPCPLVSLCGPSAKILVSPRNLAPAKRLYESGGIPVVSLNFDESAMTTHHLLSFFTPPADMRKRSVVLNTIQLIIRRLHEPLDLQQFIELLKKETWSEDGAKFIALRQTLLTSLLSHSGSSVSLSSERAIIVHLDDPVLSCTGLDGVIMDIALQRFLFNSNERRLVVLYNAHEFLTSNSLLSRSVESLAALGSTSPTSIVLSTSSPSSIPRVLCKSLDYMICGLARFEVCEHTLQENFSISLKRSQRASGGLLVWSPDSKRATQFDKEDGVENWEDKLVMIEREELKATMPELVEGAKPLPVTTVDMNTLAQGASQAVGSPAKVAKSLNVEEEEKGMVPLPERSFGPFDIKPAQGSDSLNPRGQSGGEVHFNSVPDEIVTTLDVASPRSVTSPVEQAEAAPWTQVQKGAPPMPLENKYPEIFRPLVSGILSLSNHQVDIWVGFEDLRKIIGDKKTLQELGWGTYTSYVNTCREQKLIDVKRRNGEIESVKLLQFSMREKYVKSATPAQLVLETCPARFRTLVSMILAVANDNIHAKVPIEEVSDRFAETQQVLQPSQIHAGSISHWVQQACEGGWVKQGRYQGKKCVWLGSKLQSLADNPAPHVKAEPGPDASPSPPSSVQASFPMGRYTTSSVPTYEEVANLVSAKILEATRKYSLETFGVDLPFNV